MSSGLFIHLFWNKIYNKFSCFVRNGSSRPSKWYLESRSLKSEHKRVISAYHLGVSGKTPNLLVLLRAILQLLLVIDMQIVQWPASGLLVKRAGSHMASHAVWVQTRRLEKHAGCMYMHDPNPQSWERFRRRDCGVIILPKRVFSPSPSPSPSSLVSTQALWPKGKKNRH